VPFSCVRGTGSAELGLGSIALLVRFAAAAEGRSGDRAAAGSVVKAKVGESDEIDCAGSGEDVGEDAGLAAASGPASVPGAAGGVSDFAFRSRPVRSVGLRPDIVAMGGFGVPPRGLHATARGCMCLIAS
jgi:hypothetical protein